jgi:hypothetical protein
MWVCDYGASIRGGLRDFSPLRGKGDEDRDSSCLQRKMLIKLVEGYGRKGREWECGESYDLLLSPSFLNPSIVLSISFLPPLASTNLPPILMLTFSLAFALNSRFRRRCRIWIQTYTPQSLEFSCCGLSSRFRNLSCLPNNWLIFLVAKFASLKFDGVIES